jgi:hypothetical protein
VLSPTLAVSCTEQAEHAPASAEALMPAIKWHATGGAFRKKGKWYKFSFVCKATPDHLWVLSFNFKAGEMIAEEKWSTYGLWK